MELHQQESKVLEAKALLYVINFFFQPLLLAAYEDTKCSSLQVISSRNMMMKSKNFHQNSPSLHVMLDVERDIIFLLLSSISTYRRRPR